MATAASILDDAQAYLHDPSSIIWTRAELLDYLNHGYNRLLVQTKAARHLIGLDVPPRPQWAISHPWERQYVTGSVHEWLWADNGSGSRSSYEWEAEQELAFTPTASESTYTQPWERMHSTDNFREEPERYPYPDNHLRTYRISFDGQRVPALSIQELDSYSPRWEMEDGTPIWYHHGMRRKKEFSLYPMASAYVQGIAIQEFGKGTLGTLSGTRSYTVTQEQVGEGFAFTSTADAGSTALTGPGRKVTSDTTVAADYQVIFGWEKLHVEGNTIVAGTGYAVMYGWEAVFVDQAYTTLAGLGVPETMSGGRQYLASAQTNPGASPLGTIGDWKSSEDALLLDYALDAPTLVEADTPALLPASFGKYLKYYVLGRAFEREGEGRNPALATHFMQRFTLGSKLFRRLTDFAHMMQTHQMAAATLSPGRRPKPRLPAEYPRAW